MSLTQALEPLPARLQPMLQDAFDESSDMVLPLMQRDMEPTKALMVGLALHPVGRTMLENALDIYAQPQEDLPAGWPEVIVGGGAHAAIWAATRVKRGALRPLVLEQRPRFGGTFAMTRNPSFFLNSRNRPGPLGTFGSRDALNVILGAPMQPSDLSGAEYQANADLGLVVRCTLALNAMVRQATVTAVERNGDNLVVVTNRGLVRTDRVVVATGIGRSLKFAGTDVDNERLLSFRQFMSRFDRDLFPLRGLGRVAVVGDGDSGRTVVEALAGYGPQTGASVASLDYVPRVDWYGVGTDMTKERWLECNRTRYKRLAALFPSQEGASGDNARVFGRGKARSLYRSPDGVEVNGSSYDTAIVCLGYSSTATELDVFDGMSAFGAGAQVGSPDEGVVLGYSSPDRAVVIVGPAADIPFGRNSDPAPQIPENRVALFRLAPRTATFASLV